LVSYDEDQILHIAIPEMKTLQNRIREEKKKERSRMHTYEGAQTHILHCEPFSSSVRNSAQMNEDYSVGQFYWS